MKGTVIKEFIDLKKGVTIKIGDVFECGEERGNALVQMGFIKKIIERKKKTKKKVEG